MFDFQLVNLTRYTHCQREYISTYDQLRRYIAPEAIMVDWLTWPAELVLSAGGIVASWFVSKDSLSFVALQMGFALLVLAAIVSLFAYLPALVGYWRSRSQTNHPS